MSKDIDNGGPAYPCDSETHHFNPHLCGHTLRDKFAGDVLIGGGLDGIYEFISLREPLDHKVICDRVAKFCYEIADSMIEARKK